MMRGSDRPLTERGKSVACRAFASDVWAEEALFVVQRSESNNHTSWEIALITLRARSRLYMLQSLAAKLFPERH
jgi:hypothetical protein